MAGFSIICCVVNIGDATKTLRFAKKYGIKGGTISLGRGAVGSRLLEILGINEVRKEFLTMVVEKELAVEAIKGISKDMEFHKPNHGIAFSYSVSEFIGSKNMIDENSFVGEAEKSMYCAIYVVVDKGKAEDVIEAAKKAGSKGGTIINARGGGAHEARKLFSIEVEPEKEVVIMLIKKDIKDNVIEFIRNHLKIDEPGKGILFVVDVNEVYGLHEG